MRILRWIADLKQNLIKVIKYFDTPEWQVKKRPYRYFFSAQFKAILTIVILSVGVKYSLEAESFQFMHVYAGAAIMRLLTLPRFY